MENIKQKPKIALMSYAMDNRQAKGTALYTRKLIEGLLADNNFEFYLIHYEKVDDLLYKKAHEIIMPRIRLPYGSRFVSQLLFFWKYRKNKFDIIHWFQPRLYPFYWLAPAKKIVVTVHGAGEVYVPLYFVFSRVVFNFIMIHFHKWIDMAIVDCENAGAEVVKYYGFSADHVKSIYLGGGENYKPVEKSEAKELVSKKYGISESYILDVSRLQPHKNVVSLINAYAVMRGSDVSRKEKLVIVGASACEGRTDEYDAVKRSAFAKDIIFIDYVDSEDLNAIYSGSELFVFPSLSEGFGLPVLEAMASGTPVITSNTTSLPEIAGDAAITVDPLDTDAIAKAMRRVLADKNLAKTMTESGIRQAAEFTWKKTVDQTKDLYIKLLEK
ncbi:MAG: glycosyltransferase family 1 protein [Patescibacteria group bacterium]